MNPLQLKESRGGMGKAVELELQNKLVTMATSCTLTQILLFWNFSIKKVLKGNLSGLAGIPVR